MDEPPTLSSGTILDDPLAYEEQNATITIPNLDLMTLLDAIQYHVILAGQFRSTGCLPCSPGSTVDLKTYWSDNAGPPIPSGMGVAKRLGEYTGRRALHIINQSVNEN